MDFALFKRLLSHLHQPALTRVDDFYNFHCPRERVNTLLSRLHINLCYLDVFVLFPRENI